jgi:hypothetical protein
MSRLLLALAFSLAVITGCGGGDDAGSDGGEGTTRKQFVADANAICREGEQKIDEITSQGQQEIEEGSSAAERRDVVGDLLEQTAKEYRPYLDRLRQLDPPEDIADEWSDFTAGITEAFDLIPELADATRDNDEQKLSELSGRFTDIAEDTRPFAERTGLDDCLPDDSA